MYPRPLDDDPWPKNDKSRLNQHGNLHGTTILEGKSIGFDPKKTRGQRRTQGLDNQDAR